MGYFTCHNLLCRGAKEIMSSSSVPIIPGYYGSDQSDSRLEKEAEGIGYPVLLKADRGGGGKGMRIVESSDQFQAMLNQCRSEARNFFSDDKMLIEKYVTKPRSLSYCSSCNILKLNFVSKMFVTKSVISSARKGRERRDNLL